MFSTMWTKETIHVLHHAQHRHIGFLEHGKRFGGIYTGDILGGGYQYSTIDLHFATKRGLRLTGTRREVNDQIIQRPPINRVEQLAYEHTEHIGHWCHSLLFTDKETNGHNFHAIAHQRLEFFLWGKVSTLRQRQISLRTFTGGAFTHTKHHG